MGVYLGTLVALGGLLALMLFACPVPTVPSTFFSYYSYYVKI